MLKRILALTAIAFLAACSGGEPAIEIETYDKVNQWLGVKYVEVKVIGKADEVEVQDIVVNRGNCKLEKLAEAMGRGKTVPRKLSFGESYSFTFSGPCEASEVEVVTDLGDWTWSYE